MQHVPYFESDHVVTLAYNTLADGSCIEDLELLRANEAVLNALGAQRLRLNETRCLRTA